MKTHRAHHIISLLLTVVLILPLFAVNIYAGEQTEEETAASEPYRMSPYGSVFTRELETGMEGTDVTALQSMLYRLGCYENVIDGIFGTGTETAVKAFQDYCGIIPADGIVDQETIEALDYVLSNTSNLPGFLIYDAILPVGYSYTANAMFSDGELHDVVLTSNASNISISGMTVTAHSAGNAEVCATCEGRSYKFFVSVREVEEIIAGVGNISNANNLNDGLVQRINGIAAYTGDMDSLTILAGDCFLDERLFLQDFDTRFAGSNVYSIALSGSTVEQWYNYYIQEFDGYHPASMVLGLGTNDIRRGKSAVTVINYLVALIKMIHGYMPDTIVYWWNIMPHMESDDAYYRIQAVNAAMLEYSKEDDKLVVVDCYGAVTDENGVADPSFYKDPLHPNSEGYDLMFQKTFECGLEIAEN